MTFQKLKIPMTERKMPYGSVLKIEKQFCTIPVKTWNRKLGMWEVTNEMLDHDHIAADDLKEIPNGYCRRCKKPIEHYTDKYYERHCDDNWPYCFELSEEIGYCEKCAQEKSEIAFLNQVLPEVVEENEIFKDDQLCRVKVFADGSTLEEMSQREIAAQKH